MTVVTLKSFSGEIPNLPPYLLPQENSQQSLWCDYAQKDLRPLKLGTVVNSTPFPNPVKGLYTEEGTNFFTWTTETYAYRSPVVAQSFHRVYFQNAAGLQVADYSTATTSGGPPSVSWKVGVPQPPNQIQLKVIERTIIPDYPNSSIVATAWWEDASGNQTGKATITLTSVIDFKQYTFTPPAKVTWVANDTSTSVTDGVTGNVTTTAGSGIGTGTDPAANLVCQIILYDESVSPHAEYFNVIVSAGATNPTTSRAFPGGVEVSLTNAGSLTFIWGTMETRAYDYTFYNYVNEESAPGGANIIDVTYMQEVQINITDPTSGSLFTGYVPYSGINVYRTFGTGTTYLQLTVGAGSTFDVQTQTSTITGTLQFLDTSFKASSAGTSLISQQFYVPPYPMQNLVAMPNGIFAAFYGNTLYFSEPFRPHAWPYLQTFPYNIRGICVTAQALVVTTNSGSYIVTGSTPANMQQHKLPIPQAGLDPKLMINIDGAVAFATQDGLITVTGSTASLTMSQQLFSREDWRSRYSSVLTSPSTAKMAYHDGFLVLVDSASALGFVIRLDEAAGTYTQFNEQYDDMFYMPLQDTLYYSKGAYIYRFRNDGYYTLDWWSKDFVFPGYTSFGAMYIRSTSSVTVIVYADGNQYYTFTAAGTGYYRLPSTGLNGATVLPGSALRWSIRLQSTNLIQYVAMATDMSELKNG